MQSFTRTPRRCGNAHRGSSTSASAPLPLSVSRPPPSVLQCPAAAQTDLPSISTSGPTSNQQTASTLRLPATHQESSRRALEQLKSSSVNREYTTQRHGHTSSFVLGEIRGSRAGAELEWSPLVLSLREFSCRSCW